MTRFESDIKSRKISFIIKSIFILIYIGIFSYYIHYIHILLGGIFGLEELYVSLIVLFICLIVILTSLFIVLSIKEYKFHVNRIFVQNVGIHQLSLNDIFENANRKKIIEKILKEPGIHNNELLRECGLKKGQLQWHLTVLLQYEIIKKEKLGQFTTYYPTIKDIDSEGLERNLLSKSKTTLKILDIIEDKPGINSSAISKILNLKRSSVKYHIDKLVNMNLINSSKLGREMKLSIKEVPLN